MDISTYIHSLMTYSHFDTHTHTLIDYIQPQVMKTLHIIIVTFNCKSPVLSLKRCGRSLLYGVLFSTLFFYLCFWDVESICCGCGTARIASEANQ